MSAEYEPDDVTADLVAAKISIGQELTRRLERDLGDADPKENAELAINTALGKALSRGFRLGAEITATRCGQRVIDEWDEIAERPDRLAELIFPITFTDEEEFEVDPWFERYGDVA